MSWQEKLDHYMTGLEKRNPGEPAGKMIREISESTVDGAFKIIMRLALIKVASDFIQPSLKVFSSSWLLSRPLKIA